MQKVKMTSSRRLLCYMCAHSCLPFLKHLKCYGDLLPHSQQLIHKSVQAHLQSCASSPRFTWLKEPTTNRWYFILLLMPQFQKPPSHIGTLMEERAMIKGNLNCRLAVLPMSSRATSSSLLPMVLCTSVGDRRTSGLVNPYTNIKDYH